VAMNQISRAIILFHRDLQRHGLQAADPGGGWDSPYRRAGSAGLLCGRSRESASLGRPIGGSQNARRHPHWLIGHERQSGHGECYSTRFAASQRQRCVLHKIDNVLSYVPTRQQEQPRPDLKAVFYQPDRQRADQALAAFIAKYQPICPTAIA
jgi:hypothetical protein